MTYQPIENYGIIGNMHSVALVGMNGSIDWFCLPRFDSPSIFGAILDNAKGGRFQICPVPTSNAITHKQFYWPETNVLVTRFVSQDGIGEVVDYMPVGVAPSEPGYHWLIRRVRVIRGTMCFRMECTPAFNYARDTHTTEPTGAIVAAATTSLPEGIGGERNWDYRFTWIRDAAFTVYALMRIGFTTEAA